MRVIPVIDLLGGHVVRGIAGQRDTYRPIVSQIAADAQPETVARALVDRFGFDTAYVADLDAIQQGRPDIVAWQQIASAGLELWLDAGIGSAAAAKRVDERLTEEGIRAALVVGLESLESESDLFALREAYSERPLIFSLDLQAGRLLTRLAAWQHLAPLEIVRKVEASGIKNLIILDLADVGTSGGSRTLDLCRQIRAATKFEALIAGGGVRGIADFQELASAGVDAALVASALHDQRLSREDLLQVQRPAPRAKLQAS